MQTEIITYEEVIRRAKRSHLNMSLTNKKMTLDWAKRTAKARAFRRKFKQLLAK